MLFAGIFVTMVPAAADPQRPRRASSASPQPWQFFWATGALSSFLDNAPTYLTFAAAAAGQLGDLGRPARNYLGELLGQGDARRRRCSPPSPAAR